MDNNKQLTNKKGVFINMREYYRALGVDPFSVLPQTYLVKSLADEDFRRFEQHYNRHAETVREKRAKRQAEVNAYLAKKKKEMQAKGQKPTSTRFSKPRVKPTEPTSDDEEESEGENARDKQGLI